MIHYQLRCGAGHEFDGWFKNGATFDAQVERALILCPQCGDGNVSRALMAPAIGAKRVMPQTISAPAPAPADNKLATGLPDQVRAVLQRIRADIERSSDYVGGDFADEARRIHRGESEKRNIYGESTPEQADALADEGIEVAQIPWVPRADG